MKTPKKTNRVVAVTIIALLVLASAFFIYDSVRLSNTLDRERLEKESILSEKIHLRKSLDELRKEISSVNEKNYELNLILETTKNRLEEKQKDYNRLTQKVVY